MPGLMCCILITLIDECWPCAQTKKANKKKQIKEPQVQEAQVLDDDSSIRSQLSRLAPLWAVALT